MANLINIFGGPFCAASYDQPTHTLSDSPEDDFLSFLRDKNFVVDVITPNEIIRCSTLDNEKGKPAWYLYNRFGEIGYGLYGDWRLSDDAIDSWISISENQLTPQQYEALKRNQDILKAQYQRQKVERQNKAAQKARESLDQFLAAPSDHPYAIKKGISVDRLLYDPSDKALVIPMANADGIIRNYQKIYANGSKYFLEGAQKQGCYYQIGENLTNPVSIVEGYATGDTVYRAKDKTVVCAFDAYNLIHVARIFAQRTGVEIIADNDAWNKNGEPNPPDKNTGLVQAQKICDELTNVSFTTPAFSDPQPGLSDFNDLEKVEGIQAVKQQLRPQTPNNFIQLINPTVYEVPEPLDYVVDDFFVAGTTSMIYGEPGAKKSFLALDIGLSVAYGRPWHTRETKKGCVLYIAGEGHQDLRHRVDAWKKHHDIDRETSFDFYSTEHGIDLSDPATHNHLRDYILALPQQVGSDDDVQLIIVDTLSTNFGGGDENSTDMAVCINRLNALAKETNAHIMIFHHAGKDKNKGARGSSAAKGNVYTYLRLEKGGEEHPDTVRLVTEKIKSCDMDPIVFKAEIIPLGSFADHRGRVLPITSLVLNIEKDCNADREQAEAVINTEEQKILKAPERTLHIIYEIASEQLARKPEMKTVLVCKKEVRSRMKEIRIDTSNSGRIFAQLAEDNPIKILTKDIRVDDISQLSPTKNLDFKSRDLPTRPPKNDDKP